MKMKRLTALILAAVCAAALTACGGSSGGQSSQSGDASMPDEPSVSTMAPVEPDPQPEPKPEPEPAFPYTNPLTGEGMETDISANRPIAIMLNNLKKALPQLGVAQADIIYELPAEGGITRMLGVFQSVEGVGEIGSVRSARDYYVSLAYGHDAIFLHAGGSPQAYTAIKSWGVTALDCVNGPYEGTLYWRDSYRKKNMGLEHSVLTSGETIQKLLPTYSRLNLTHKASYTEPLTFLGAEEKADGTPAASVKVKFSSYKTGQFAYDADSGLYRVSQHNAPYVDGNTGEQVAVKNVVVLFTDVASIKGDEAGRQSVRTTGTGQGLLFCDGVQQAITWSKADHDQPLTYSYADGTPVKFGVGSTYVNIIGDSAGVTVG